jgi:hypothetical protein
MRRLLAIGPAAALMACSLLLESGYSSVDRAVEAEGGGRNRYDRRGGGGGPPADTSATWRAAGIPGSGGTPLSLTGEGSVTIGDKFDFPGRIAFSLEA